MATQQPDRQPDETLEAILASAQRLEASAEKIAQNTGCLLAFLIASGVMALFALVWGN